MHLKLISPHLLLVLLQLSTPLNGSPSPNPDPNPNPNPNPQDTTITSTINIPGSTATTTQTSTLVAVTAASPSLSSQYNNSVTFRNSILNSTNLFRYEHSAPFMYWNSSLATYAQNYVNRCVWAHSGGPSGENLAIGFANVTSAVDAWGNERAMYVFSASNPTGFSEATGHFTQLVWQSSRAVGCGWRDCSGINNLQGVYVVCEYWPAGNVAGDSNRYFIANVAPQSNSGQGFNVSLAESGANGSTSAIGTITPSTTGPGATGRATASATAGAERVGLGWDMGMVMVAVMVASGMLCEINGKMTGREM